ncbi:MAG: corrinoid protein [Candidatus Cloacimonetes bacterium]|nr:corrinoid protein [Candidatus Cloacimonadota bacterium]
MENILSLLSTCIERGKENKQSPYPADLKDMDGALELTKKALMLDFAPTEILQKGMTAGMQAIGEKFSKGEAFIPELLISAKAMYAAMSVLKPFFDSGEVEQKGTIILGTVAGDLHDIGKNIVRMVLEGDGWKVIDLGVDVTTDKFISTLEENPQSFVGMSALLTTTMMYMEKSVQEIKNEYCGTKIFVGGAPLTREFSDKIGADGFFSEPHSFVKYLNNFIESK